MKDIYSQPLHGNTALHNGEVNSPSHQALMIVNFLFWFGKFLFEFHMNLHHHDLIHYRHHHHHHYTY